MKITAVVCNRDEQTLVKSILSIDKAVDEVVLVDASKFSVESEVDEIREKIRCGFKFFQTMPHIVKQFNYGINHASHPVIMRWDSDFIGHKNVDQLTDFIRSIRTQYFSVSFQVKNIFDDGRKHTFHREDYVFSLSKNIINENRLHRRVDNLARDVLRVPRKRFSFYPLPLYYTRFSFKPCVVNHVNLKLEYRDAERPYQYYWSSLSSVEKEQYDGFEDYVKQMISKGVKGNVKKFEKIPYN